MSNAIALKDTLGVIDDSNNYNTWLYHSIEPYMKGIVLDVGSGIGSIAHNFTKHPFIKKIILSDNDADFTSILKDRFKDDGRIEVLRLDISASPSSGINIKGSCDVVTCINVLEHIEDDTFALKNLRGFLKQEGLLILILPNSPLLYGTLDRLVGHYRRYTKKEIADKLISSGYSPEKIFYLNLAGVVTWFLAGRVLKRKVFSDWACQELDRCVPFLEKTEKIIKPFFGQSIVVIAKS